MQQDRVCDHQGSQFKPTNLVVELSKLIREGLLLMSLEHMKNKFTCRRGLWAYKDTSLSFLRLSQQQIFIVCKTLALLRMYVANWTSPCWPLKYQSVQVLRCNEMHRGTDAGSTQFSWSMSLIPSPTAVPY